MIVDAEDRQGYRLSRYCRALVPALIAVAPSLAMADAVGYRATVRGNTVVVCADKNERQCPDPEGMLRQRLGRRRPRLLSQSCVRRGNYVCYLDECVPRGKYRYGLARPYPCYGDGPTDYFIDVEVKRELDVDQCRRRGSKKSHRHRLDAPWRGHGATVCGSHCGSCSSGSSAPETVVIVYLVLGIAVLLWVRRRRLRRL